jgi:hypothetical protein
MPELINDRDLSVENVNAGFATVFLALGNLRKYKKSVTQQRVISRFLENFLELLHQKHC